MAIHMLNDASLVVNAVNLSNHVQSITVDMAAEDVDITAMGATSRAHLAGLRDDTVSVTFFQDFAASNVDATLAPLITSTGFSIVVKPTSATVSSTNPSYTATMIMLGYQPLSGTVGDANTIELEFKAAAGSAIVRATV